MVACTACVHVLYFMSSDLGSAPEDGPRASLWAQGGLGRNGKQARVSGEVGFMRRDPPCVQ